MSAFDPLLTFVSAQTCTVGRAVEKVHGRSRGEMNMATLQRTATAPRDQFFLWMTFALAVIAIGGFMPTYWLQLPAQTFRGPPILHIHGVLCTAWILFLMTQTWLVSEGRIRRH